MEWKEEAIILGTRRHGETNVILEVMSPSHGRYLGLVHRGQLQNMRAILQPGNSIEVIWRARLSEHLGHFRIEPLDLRTAWLFEIPLGVFAVQTLAAHLRLLPERDPHPSLYRAVNIILGNLANPAIAGELLVCFEIAMLKELGFGLDLDKCAVNGTNDDLVWVSPKSGRAVSREAGIAWANRLLPMPSFLTRKNCKNVASLAEIEDGLRLTGFFFQRYVHEIRSTVFPYERNGFINVLRCEL